MGHRAVVAYERPGGGYAVRYSQWGARGYRLLDAITASTPLGGGDADDDPAVRPEPLGTAADLAAVAASFVDPLLHEAVFVVSSGFDVRAFEPLAFWGRVPTAAFGGAVVELRLGREPTAEARELRAWRRGATALADWPPAATEDDPRRVPTEASTAVHDRLYDALAEEAGERECHPVPPASSGTDS